MAVPPSFSIWTQIRTASRPIRYTVYTGLLLAATAETTFWANIIYAKYFATTQDRERADALLARVHEAVKGYRVRWLINYRNYYSHNLWGL
ncbi:hypothetical protein GRF29_164g1093475 [Pseudopithomyces chartarum]|uniref:Uncharacterized protein n=1 Tax=Pseudopithomyces chartarum TaxID=1892770 RepID=A0AAN6LQ00_9PLEO|nr:hypothetical protein GRF29_164g1093475 [Pseudopithomyces chartarum]